MAPSSGQPGRYGRAAARPPGPPASAASADWRGFGQRVAPRIERRLAGHLQPQGQVEFGDAPGTVACGNVNQDSGAGPGVLGRVVVVDQRHAGFLGGVGQGVGHQRVAAPGQHHGADIVVGGAGEAGDLQAGPDDSQVEGGVVRGQDVPADEGSDLGEQVPEPGQSGHRVRPDPVDPDVVMIERVVVFRRPHEPGCFLDDDAAADLGQADGARGTAKSVRSFKVDRRKVQSHGSTLPSRAALRRILRSR